MSDYYEIIPQEPGHYRITSKEAVFMDLFVGGEKALLVDTGYGYGNLKDEVKKITNLPLIIVNSHGHLDHSCGNYQFEETIYIHEKDVALCREHTSVERRSEAMETAKHTMNFVTGTIENILPDDFDEETYRNGGTGKLALIKEGDRFELGGLTLTVYEFPGHTVGSIGLLWEEKKYMFVGDAMNQFLWLFMPEALTLQEYRRTLDKAWAMDFTHFYVSHNLSRMEKTALLDFMDAADHVEYEKGFLFETPLAPGVTARVCAREGYGPMDFDKPGFASVVISEGHF